MREMRALSLAVGLVLVGCAVESGSTTPEAESGLRGSDGERSGARKETAEAPVTLPGDTTPSPSSAVFDAEFNAASTEFNVPAAVLKGIAWTETRYAMVAGEEEFAGKPAAFGVMALSGDRLVAGAKLAGVDVEVAKTSPVANVRAAAALLSSIADELSIARDVSLAWEPVIARYSAIESADARRDFVRDGVFRAVKQGLGAIEIGDHSYFGLFDSEITGPQEIKAAGPDYASSIWRGSPNWNSRGGISPAMVIIHTCEGSYSSCWSWLSNSAAQASAHYVVKEDGMETTQLVRESNRAWHVGANYNCNLNSGVDCGRQGQSVNTFSVGIEHAGFASQSTFSAGQLEASARLVCDITKDHDIARDRFHIVGHGKLQPYDRTDPGPNWPWGSYITRINELCGSGTPPPPPPPPPADDAIVVDSNNGRNDQAIAFMELSSNWTASTNVAGYWGTGYWWADTAAVSDGATFWFHLSADATKTIDGHWSAASDRAPDAPFVAFDSHGTRLGVAYANERTNGGKWNQLGSWSFTAGWNKVVLSRWTSSGNIVVADAVRVR